MISTILLELIVYLHIGHLHSNLLFRHFFQFFKSVSWVNEHVVHFIWVQMNVGVRHWHCLEGIFMSVSKECERVKMHV